MMLSGKMGVRAAEGDVGEDNDDDPLDAFNALASAIADATGTFVSSKQPAGTQPCLLVSVSKIPDPVGSRWTTHQPRARDSMTKVSPLGIQFQK